MTSQRLLLLLYTASGAAALVYEVAWTRMLTLQLGHTVAAASTVLAAFMGGLAVGAWLAGTKPIAYDRAMRVYAVLEVVIAVSALLIPGALRATVPLLAWAYADGAAPARFAIVRVAISLLLLGIPAAAMGATFPIASEWLASRGRGSDVATRGRGSDVATRGRGSDVATRGRGSDDTLTTPVPDSDTSGASRLYAANTAGAAIGAIAAGFWLIPSVGLRATTWVGVALNLAAAGGALWLQSIAPRGSENTSVIVDKAKPGTQKASSRPARSVRPTVQPSPVIAVAAVGVSGFAALVYEVAWTRLLALVIGPTTYAFATMAAAFIAGLATGSAIGAPLARRSTRPATWLAGLLVAGGVASAASSWYAATQVPLLVAAQVASPDVVFGRIVVAQAFGVAVLLLPTTLALGAMFPFALAAANDRASSVAGTTARVYTANTIGAIAGALAAGFVLIPLLGLRSTFQAAALTSVIAGAACLASARSSRTTATATVAVLSVAAILFLPQWDRALLASGAYKYAPYLQSDDLDTILRAGTLEYYKEGAAGTVNVRRLTGTRSLAIDGKVDASNGGDMLTQRLLGLLPVLIHGDAREIAVIGLGSGVTAASALAPGTVRRADVVEISPEVVEASHFFDEESGRVLGQPGMRLIVGDGRSHLLLTPRRYDVIISEPSNPWMSGVASLFTREFFEAARARLEPRGLLCQWAHTYDISADDLKSIVRTFASVFPQGTMWLVGEGDLLLIGGDGDIAARLDAIAGGTTKGSTPAMLRSLGIEPDAAAFSLLSLFAGGPRDIAAYAGTSAIQTDDRLPLEYSAPRGIYGRTTNENGAAIRALAPPDPPAAVKAALAGATDRSWTSRGSMLLKAEAFDLAYDAFRRAVALDGANASALTGLSDAAAGAHHEKDARELLAAIAARETANAPVRVELARVMASAGEYDAAVGMAQEALRIAPDDPRAGEQLASVLADVGDADRLSAIADRLVERFPGRPDPAYYRAAALFLHGRAEDAYTAIRPVTAANPGHARAQNLLGAACATLGRRDCARAAFEASIRANPHDDSTYVNLATFHLQNGDPDQAARSFAEALAIDPRSEAARNGLAQARAQRR